MGVVLAWVACTPAWGQGAKPEPSGAARLVGAGEVVPVGLLENFPPLHSWADPAKPPVGLDIDLLAELSRTTGLRFKFRRFTDFESLTRALRNGEVRLITATAQTTERSATMRFTHPYATVQQAFVGARSITSVPSTPDLSGRRVAVTRGHVAESIALERYPAASRPVYPTVDAAVDAVVHGEADFVFEALPTLRTLVEARPQAHLAVLRTYGFPEGHLRLAGHVADAALVQQLDAALLSMDPARLQALSKQWLAPPAQASWAPVKATDAIAPLRVGYLQGDSPYSVQRPDGQAEGIGIDMMKAVARRSGLTIRGFQAFNLGDGLKALEAGHIDIMLGLTDISQRRGSMTFVGPYRANPLVIISRKHSSMWGLSQLSNQRLAVVAGYFGTPYIKAANPAIDIVECARFEQCLDLVEQGRADAGLYGLQGAYARLAARAGTSLQITGTVPGLYDEHNLGVALGRASLAPLLRDALTEVIQDELPGIERDWAQHEAAERIDWAQVRLAVVAISVLFVLLALAWWWHTRALRKEIGRTDAARNESEQYLAFMAHEVRNSLQSVSGAVALMRGSLPIDSGQQLLLDALGQCSRSTLGLLNGLLDRHRLHEGRLALQLRTDSLERTLRAVVDEMQSAAMAKGLSLRMESNDAFSGWWRIDSLRLQQIVRNLLVNAVKFSRRGVIRLRVSLRPSVRGGVWQCVVIDVVDEGTGMDSQMLEAAFERFQTQGGDRPGTGLGLHLCRELARVMGGELQVASQPGRGTTVTLTFDAEKVSVPDASESGRIERILIVEDSAVYGLLLQQAFDREGVSAVVVESLRAGRAALEALSAPGDAAMPHFDLVLSDTHLGDGDVPELIEFMRASPNPAVSTLPLVCMSAEFDAASLDALKQLGVTELLTKDSDVTTFAARIINGLGH